MSAFLHRARCNRLVIFKVITPIARLTALDVIAQEDAPDSLHRQESGPAMPVENRFFSALYSSLRLIRIIHEHGFRHCKRPSSNSFDNSRSLACPAYNASKNASSSYRAASSMAANGRFSYKGNKACPLTLPSGCGHTGGRFVRGNHYCVKRRNTMGV